MKFAHLSDLHLGKKVDEYSMIEDQAYILQQILQILDEERPDGVIIAGDVYDKSVPSAEAVTLFDAFLVDLAKRKLHVFVISGNHDSPERIAFGARLMQAGNVFLSPVYNGTVTPVTLEDAYGKIKVWMLPFVKPVHVRKAFPEEEIASYTDAVRVAVDHMPVDTGERNIMITHQFVTGAERSESETVSVGGTDNVDVSVFDSFDYVALGHIHCPQWVKGGTKVARYCGTPRPIHFDETYDHGVDVVTVEAGKAPEARTQVFEPLHALATIGGKDGLPFEDALKALAESPLPPGTYIRLNVRLGVGELSGPDWTERARKDCAAKGFRFCLINTIRTEAPERQESKMTLTMAELKGLSNDEVLRILSTRHELTDRQCALVKSLMEEVRS